jgi:molybdopterin molybdotransferase
MVEYTERQGNVVTIQRTASRGENFVRVGAEARAGQVLLAPGTHLNHAAIAVAASTGHAEVPVHARPRVAILATGDELVDLDAQPGPSQIRNSNSYSLAAQVTAAGGTPEILPTAPDNEKALRELIARGLQSDLLLVTGGVSMGRFDLVEQVLGGLGAEFIFTGALIQPGRPVVFGCVPSCARMFFGLPGNPVSTMVTFDLFVRPVLDALCGTLPRPLQFLHAYLKSEFRTKPGLTRFLPAVLTGQSDSSEVKLVHWHGSGDVVAAATANCYVVIPPERDSISADEPVAVLLQNAWF